MRFPDPIISGPVRGHAIFGGPIGGRSRHFAIYDDSGAALPDTDIVSGLLTSHAEPDVELGQDHTRIDAPVLFCGLAAQQYGHVLTNSLGRLWALKQLPSDTVLYFLPQRRRFPKLYPHLRPVLASLGIERQILLVKSPHRFDRLYTAPEIYGERFGGLGSEAFFDWLDRRWPSAGPVSRGRKLYVSRAQLGPKVGRYACEDHLETLLARAGYEIYHPQAHDLLHQVSTLKDAERLIFAESSALHLYALIRRPEQRAVVIQRRKSLPDLILQQLAARPGPPVEAIDVILNEFWPPIRQDNLSVSELDFGGLRDRLVQAKMLEASDPWTAPSADQLAASLNAAVGPGEALLSRKERKKFLQDLRSK